MPLKPSTNLKIIKVPLAIDYKNQLTFKNATEQFNYFNNLECIEIDEISYQRHNSIISFPAHIDSILEYNYCMFQNENYGDKWFYAFITNMSYQADCCTEITIATDVFQTWQFDFMFKQSFVEREMINVSDDVPGSNLIPEGLELGELKINATAGFDELEHVYVIAFSGDKFGEQSINQDGFDYNGIFSSITFFVTNSLRVGLGVINQNGLGASIVTVFTVPKLAVWDFIPHDTDSHERTYYCKAIQEDYKQAEIIKILNSTPSALDNYTPRNKKLLTYPYIYLGFNPQNGSKNIYRYEDFADGTPKFKIISEINPNPTVQFIPQNYRGQTGDSLSDNATMNGYPNISQKNEYYNSWLAQNAETINLSMEQQYYNAEMSLYQQGLQIGSSMLGMATNPENLGNITGFASGLINLLSSAKNYDYNVKQQMTQVEKQKLLPDNVSLSSSNSTLLGYNLLKNNVFTRYSIKQEYAKRIDKFFDVYGYLTNEFKIPNTNNRPNWNYLKLTQCNIAGNIPQQDLQELKLIFEKGITLWHNSSTFLDYSQNNR